MTNREFGTAVRCSDTMASRMRNGQRLPSVDMLARIVAAFDLDASEAVAHATSARRWGAYLRDEVFTRTHARAHAQLESAQPEEAANE